MYSKMTPCIQVLISISDEKNNMFFRFTFLPPEAQVIKGIEFHHQQILICGTGIFL